jgi:hypothetical protein
MTKIIRLRVDSADELRDCLYHSGVFDMSDCAVEISCSMENPEDEVNKMFDVIKYAIHVVSTTYIPDEDIHDYRVSIQEVPVPFMKKKSPRSRPQK